MNSELNNLVFDIVWERICALTGWKRYSELADFLQIKPASVSGANKRGFISLEWVFKVAQGFNASTDYLATGQGPIRRDTKQQLAKEIGYELVDEPDQWEEGYVQVPRYEISASAGGGTLVHSELIVDVMTFQSDWLKVCLGLSPDHAAVIGVSGNSMEPFLNDGDLILIDTGVNKVVNNDIYVIQYDDSLLIKRIQRNMDGTVIVKSDNPHYESEIFIGEMAQRLRVIGRLVRRLVR